MEDNAERFANLDDMLAGIRGYNRLPGWVKAEIGDIWETFHAIAEEPEEPTLEEYEEPEYNPESLFDRIRAFISRVFYPEDEEEEE